jgi:hypothetical protein
MARIVIKRAGIFAGYHREYKERALNFGVNDKSLPDYSQIL